MSQKIRTAAVAGSFYPDTAATINAQIDAFWRKSASRKAQLDGCNRGGSPKALIVPHAGWIYSGQLAADAYSTLKQSADKVKRIILLGPAHRVAFEGLALPDATGFATPLGVMPIDQEAMALALGQAGVVVNDDAHRAEHCLEVQLPFLQRLFPQAACVPILVGRADTGMVAQLIGALWGGEETKIIISSDLSHYQTYDQARANDWLSVLSILRETPLHNFEQACGALPINAMIQAAKEHGLRPKLLGAINSGDTAGDRERVVGYAAFTFHEGGSGQALPEEAGRLLALARAAIHSSLGLPVPPIPNAPWLAQPAASFVTLNKAGVLRGCIGSLQAHRPLSEDIINNARGAAFQDPRFSPVNVGELADIIVEVSLLSTSQVLHVSSEREALATIRPGVDGLILQSGNRRGTFLPQVWSQLPDPAQFLNQLKLKAGLPADAWGADWQLSRYTVNKWSESDLVAV